MKLKHLASTIAGFAMLAGGAIMSGNAWMIVMAIGMMWLLLDLIQSFRLLAKDYTDHIKTRH